MADIEAPSGPPQFSFFGELSIMNKQIWALPSYPCFLVKWIILQLLTISGSVSFLIFTVVQKELDLTQQLTTEVYVWFAVIGLLQIVSRVAPPCNSLIIDQLKGSLQVAHGTSVIKKIFEMEHDAMISTPTGKFGQLISKIFMNVDKLLPALYGGVLSTILNLLVGVILLGIFFGPISFVLIVLYIAFTIAAYRAARQTALRNKDMMTAMFSEWGKLLAIASSYERAHFFDRVSYEVSNAEQSFQTISTKMSSVLQGTHISSAVLQIISTGITVLCVAVIIPVMASQATSFEIIGLFFYFFNFVGTLEKYAMDLTELRSALFEAMTLSEFIKSKSNVTDQQNAVNLELTPNPSITFENVSFSYQNKTILNNISFSIQGGDTLGLVGASGCGKSTILRLLLRFYRPTSGTIYINGIDIQTMTGTSLRSAFSVVTQTSQLMAGTIRTNIEYGKQGATDKELLSAAQCAELILDDVHVDNDDDDGNVGNYKVSQVLEGSTGLSLDKDVGEGGAKLSGGQQQRVSIARAMLKNGTIYLLDEPTTGLDGIVAQQLQKTLDGLASQATTIMVTHNLQDLRNVNCILFLKDGMIVEKGTYDELCAAEGEFFKQTQARVVDGDAAGGTEEEKKDA